MPSKIRKRSALEFIRIQVVQILLLLIICGTAAHAAGAIYTSQLGYTAGDPKIAVLAVTTGTSVQRSFRVLGWPSGNEVFASGLNDAIPYPGGWFGNDATGDTYLLDFSLATPASGNYRVESNGYYSAPFAIGPNVYDVARLRPLEFFRVEMSGVPYSWVSLDGSIGGHGADHMDDARQATRKDKGGGDTALIQQDYLALPGGRLDVSGGWSDAGDYNKYMGNTPWAAYLLLLTLEENSAYWSAVDDNHNGVPDLREVVRPALDWMLKMQHTDGSTYERVFNGFTGQFDGRPDLETDNIPGNAADRPLDTDRFADITAKSVYAFAAGYRIFGDQRYRDAAVRAWDWAFANQTRVKAKIYGGGIYFGDVEIGLTLGALELQRTLTNPDAKYMNYANTHVRSHLDAANWTSPSSWDYQQSYALMRYYDLASAADKARIIAQMEGRWDFGISKQNANAYRMNDEWLYGDFGQNENSTSGAGDALWLYGKSSRADKRKYYDYAVNQMSWVFGRNPFGESWLATPLVSEYTRVPHWRATAKHPIEGVVVPGATDRNSNGRPDYTDTGDWFYSEPTINQQAMFLRVMTALYLASGGVVNPNPDPPPAVSITSPVDGSTVSGSIVIAANVSDSGGVSTVNYRVDNGTAQTMLLQSGGTVNNGVWQASLSTMALADGVRKITVIATDTIAQQSSPFVNVNVRNSAQQALHVERIDVALLQKGGSRIQGRGDIFIYDAFGIPVSDATVTGHWTGAANDTFTVTTDATGKAQDFSNSSSAPSGSVFTCVVDSVSKSGWQYSPAANKQNSGSAIVP